jgi:hypothetical protein
VQNLAASARTQGVLVRPDGFVAWRSRAAQEAPEQVLAYSLRHLLCRAPEPSRRSEAA